MNLMKAIFSVLMFLSPGVAMSSSNELDSQIAEVAEFFSGSLRGKTDVLFPEKLDRNRLNYSLDSLDIVSAWLSVLRKHGVHADSEEAAETIIWSGAYVGEVIKRCAKTPYVWLPYEEYMKTQKPSLRNLIPYSFGTQFVLASTTGAMTLPINKVVRFLEEGPENDLRFYASGECKSGK